MVDCRVSAEPVIYSVIIALNKSVNMLRAEPAQQHADKSTLFYVSFVSHSPFYTHELTPGSILHHLVPHTVPILSSLRSIHRQSHSPFLISLVENMTKFSFQNIIRRDSFINRRVVLKTVLLSSSQ